MPFARLDTSSQFLYRLRLIARRLEIGDDLERRDRPLQIGDGTCHRIDH